VTVAVMIEQFPIFHLRIANEGKTSANGMRLWSAPHFGETLGGIRARHLLATRRRHCMVEHDTDIRYVQEMLGDASIQTTEVYTHVSIKALNPQRNASRR